MIVRYQFRRGGYYASGQCECDSLEQAEESHRIAMMNNPDEYDDIDDIESDEDTENNQA